MTCKAAHTEIQPSSNDWICPKCEIENSLYIEEPDHASEEGCPRLHVNDELRCPCGYGSMGEDYAKLIPKLEKWDKSTAKQDIGETSDGYHTFNELYEHRHMLFLALMASHSHYAWFSRLHSDGTSMVGWFVAGIDLDDKTITYHLPERLFDLVKETHATLLDKAPEWDGHTPADVVERLKSSLDWCYMQGVSQ